MTDLEDLGEVYSTDVLILGGGLAGLVAANKIKELNGDLDVLVVEKATTGFGGKANKGAGVLWVMSEDDDIDKFREFHIKNIGYYLEDQELLEKVCGTTLNVVEHFERWGIQIMREKDGKLARIEALPLWSLCALDLDLMEKLRKLAVKLGVKMMDKTQSVELLTEGDRVVGSVAFNLLNGRFSIFKAKTVLLATGSCCWMVMNMWSSARGDGIAAAYRAGAELRNAEFGNFYNLHLRGNMAPLTGCQYALYNSEDEYLSQKYCAEFECDIDRGIILGMENEVAEGKGPVVFEEGEMFAKNPLASGGFLFRWTRPTADRFWKTLFMKNKQYTSDHEWRPEVIPGFMGEFSPLKVDHTMKTNLPGLWALGDSCYAGSSWAGAVPGPPGRLRGSGLMFASVSALLSAQPVVDYTAGAREPRIDKDQVRKYKEATFAPMERRNGLSPRDCIFQLKEVVAPPYYSMRKNRDRIQEALAKVRKIEQQVAEVAPANDWHMLGLCHDLRNMALCADIYFNAALARTESRGWHYREDYSERDDKNWLKWIIVKQKDRKMVISAEDIPIQKYKTKP
jgi:succinate dehydrogenase/fumarate reductase flavoprotein subunit